MLQAMKEEPPLNAKCKDKFLIQSTVINSENEAMSLQEIVHLTCVLVAPQGMTNLAWGCSSGPDAP